MELQNPRAGSWVCDTNGFRFVYKWEAQLVDNTKCSLKCEDEYQVAGIINRNVRKLKKIVIRNIFIDIKI